MDRATFVRSFRLAVERTASAGVRLQARAPAGRNPDPVVVGLSDWYLSLSDSDQGMVDAVIAMTAEQTTYNALLVFDGLVAIEDSGDKGVLRLRYEDVEGEETLINDPTAESLSALFKDTSLG